MKQEIENIWKKIPKTLIGNLLVQLLFIDNTFIDHNAEYIINHNTELIQSYKHHRCGVYKYYRNYHKTFRPDDDVDLDDEPYPEYSLYDNDQEREEVKNLLKEEVKYDPPIITLYALENCSCTLGCECNRQFYWYYYCYLFDENRHTGV